MGLFKKKARPAEGKQEFEETLVAEAEGDAALPDAPGGDPTASMDAPSEEGSVFDEPSPFLPEDGEAVLADEPVAPESFGEPELVAEPAPDLVPGEAVENVANVPPPMEPIAPQAEFPTDVESHLRRTAGELYLLEHRFTRPVKLDLESKVTSSPRSTLSEARWRPKHKASLVQIRRQVDRLRVKPTRLREGEWLRRRFKPVAPRAREGFTRIPQNILDKRIVYETEGGFVVEVTYRELGEARKAYFTVSSQGGRTRALNTVQSGRYAELTVVSDETLRRIGRPKGRAQLQFPPGQVHTYPITNKVEVQGIEGIGDVYSRRLHELGLHTTDQLRLTNATVIANNLGVNVASVQQWQQMAELMCVKGIGRQSSEALVRSGIGSIEDLARLKPKDLAERVNKTVGSSKPRIMGQRVQPKRAWGWILAARHMKRTTQPFPVVEA